MQGGIPEDLTSFVSRMGGDKALRVEENLGQGFVRLRVAEAERRQARHDIRCSEDIVIEMLRNARDAGAHRIFLATTREGDRRSIVMLDDGEGIPPELHERIFDARVTSKLESVHMDRWGIHGRGMALYAVRENTLEAKVMASAPGLGTSIRVVSDTTTLPEKADQSSWPEMGRDDDNQQVIARGPHNIIRTCCEFALEERGSCEVTLGSAADIVASARARVRPSVGGSDLLFLESLDELPILERFGVAADARELRATAEAVGLALSERTAHRILAGQIRPVRPVLARLTHHAATRHRPVDLAHDQRGLRLSEDDAERFARMMERDFAYLSERYFLTLSQAPRIRVSGNRLTVSFEYEGED